MFKRKMYEINKFDNKNNITSLEIAEITGKRHADVMRDIRNLIEQGANECNFALVDYKDKKGEMRPCYNLTPKGCLILASGYDVVLREKIINRLEELETEKKRGGFLIPQTFSEALMLAAKQQKKIEEQQRTLMQNENEIKTLSDTVATMKPKADYCDLILRNTATICTTSIAQNYGMSAKAFNILLRNFDIQHKIAGQWILKAKYLPYGYIQSESVVIEHNDGRKETKQHSKWTQKGHLFLYEELKKHGVFPLIEQNK